MTANRQPEKEERADRAPVEAPRIKDLPLPRRTKGVIGPLFRWIFAWPYRMGLMGLYRAGFRAWHLTVLSLFANGAIGWMLVEGMRLLPGGLLLAAGLLDIFDGGMARLRGEESRAGAFLDSVIDRVCDSIVFGCLFWSLAGEGHRLAAALTLVTLVLSLFISQIKAEVEAQGMPMNEGLAQRLERYIALVLGLMIPGALVPVLMLLTLLAALTVSQRLWSAWRQLAVEQ